MPVALLGRVQEFARTAKMLVLIPAHNEASIGNPLNALLAQSRVPDRIVALADNCTDKTEQIARRFRGSC